MVLINSIFLKYCIVLSTNLLLSLYVYLKISKTKLFKKQKILVSISIVLIVLSCSFLKTIDFPYYRIVYWILSTIVFIYFSNLTYYIALPLCFISLDIVYFFEITSILILGSIFYHLGSREINIINELLSSLLQVIFVILFVRIKRFNSLIKVFENKNNFTLGIVFAGPLLVFESIHKEQISIGGITILTVGVLISTIGLLFWILSAITRHYRKKLKLRAEEYSKLELAEKNKEIETLSNENTSLSNIIHLDNHIIQSIETELNNFRNLDTSNSELKKKLLISINQRNNYVNEVLIKNKNLSSTGNTEIDVVLTDLYIKAASRGIDFTLNVDCDINFLIHNIIEQADFEELIRNCITSSIVDIESNPDAIGKILITISKPNDIYEFIIMDTGVSKDDNSKLISDIIEKSNASINTNKFANNETFTKSLTVRFDGLKNNTQ